MSEVHFRRIEQSNLRECLQLAVDEQQEKLVASTAQSLAEAYVGSNLYPFGIYDNANLGFETPVTPMVGFVMLQVSAGVGFLLRLMIDARFQRRGYARAAVKETIRRFQFMPDVHTIATSHLRSNRVAQQLFEREGFAPWSIAYARNHPTEAYLYLKNWRTDGSTH